MLDFLGAMLYIVVTVVLMALVVVVGAIAAVSAAAAAIVALPLSVLISLIWGVAFIDILAWTWSLLTLVTFLAGLVVAKSELPEARALEFSMVPQATL